MNDSRYDTGTYLSNFKLKINFIKWNVYQVDVKLENVSVNFIRQLMFCQELIENVWNFSDDKFQIFGRQTFLLRPSFEQTDGVDDDFFKELRRLVDVRAVDVENYRNLQTKNIQIT